MEENNDGCIILIIITLVAIFAAKYDLRFTVGLLCMGIATAMASGASDERDDDYF